MIVPNLQDSSKLHEQVILTPLNQTLHIVFSPADEDLGFLKGSLKPNNP